MRKLRTIEMNRLTLEEFKEAEKLPLIVVLDDVRSLYNVGSVFRSCDAFRVEAVYLCGITATPPNAEIHKTALGGEDSVDWEYFKTTEEAVEKLKQKGYFVYSIEQVEGSTKLQNLPEAHEELFNQQNESVKQENSSLFVLHSSLKFFTLHLNDFLRAFHQCFGTMLNKEILITESPQHAYTWHSCSTCSINIYIAIANIDSTIGIST